MSALALASALVFVCAAWLGSVGWGAQLEPSPVGRSDRQESPATRAEAERGVGTLERESCDPELVRRLRALGRAVACGRVLPRTSGNVLHAPEIAFLHVPCQRAPGGCEVAPLLVFAGGPGDSLLSDFSRRIDYWLPLVEARGLVVVDARGTGQSAPLLTCPSGIHEEADLRRCYQRWSQEVDLDGFRTPQLIQDVWSVLQVLQVPRVVAYGVSYGTHAATEFARVHPRATEALVLDSPLPRGRDVLSPIGRNAQAALSALLGACRESGSCSSDLTLAKLASLVSDLDVSSREGQTKPPGSPSGTEFLSQVVGWMHSPATLAAIPWLVQRAGEGDFRLFRKIRSSIEHYPFPWGMHLSIQCAERFPWMNRNRLKEFDAAVLPPLREALSGRHYLEYCSIWSVAQRPVTELAVQIETPALVLSGQFDGVTPREYALQVLGDFRQAVHVKVPGVAHGVALTPCGTQHVRAFLDRDNDPSSPDETTCSPLSFVQPGPEDERIERMVDELNHRL